MTKSSKTSRPGSEGCSMNQDGVGFSLNNFAGVPQSIRAIGGAIVLEASKGKFLAVLDVSGPNIICHNF